MPKQEHSLDERDLKSVYIETVAKLIDEGFPLAIVTADFAYGMGMLEFAEQYPNHFINVGIAEQNMASFAGGLAVEGYIPFIHAFAVFCSRRALDQIYISEAYSKLNVKVVGADPGYTSGHNGGTHMAMEDVGIFRMIPGALIVEPTDAAMLRKILPQIVRYEGFTYIRLYRGKAVSIYTENDNIVLGRAAMLRDGYALTVITAGRCVPDVLEAADLFQERGIKIRVLDMFTIKPLDIKAVRAAAEETGGILIVENHSRKGGIGTAVLEALENYADIPVVRMGRDDVFGEVGTEKELKMHYHLSCADIVRQIETMLK